MIIYENNMLFIPENGNELEISPDEVYQQAYAAGYNDGYQKGRQDCENL